MEGRRPRSDPPSCTS
uniref:Uncharacterized protein n=1 Tax=Arundo donax TaxID=35708 RepID=A0A0A9FJC2_ARUDO